MDEKAELLKRLIDSAGRILVISHIAPDPDALCSLLLSGTALKENYPDKQIVMSSEELTGDLEFLAGYGDIEQQPLLTAIEKYRPELIIIVDAMNFGRCTRGDAGAVAALVKNYSAKLAIIDHHEPEGVEANSLYINDDSPAATQEVYHIFLEQLKFRKPEGYGQTTMLGILSDTFRFMYDNRRHRDTFRVTSDLIDAGISIERLENRLSRFSQDEMRVFGQLADNITAADGHSYSFISDDFTDRWLSAGKSFDELKLGCEIFVSRYIRNIDGNHWGYIIYPDIVSGPGKYSVSFRSLSGIKDVSLIAKQLGGGGHKPAAGAKFDAASVEAAIGKVEQAIAEA